MRIAFSWDYDSRLCRVSMAAARLSLRSAPPQQVPTNLPDDAPKCAKNKPGKWRAYDSFSEKSATKYVTRLRHAPPPVIHPDPVGGSPKRISFPIRRFSRRPSALCSYSKKKSLSRVLHSSLFLALILFICFSSTFELSPY